MAGSPQGTRSLLPWHSEWIIHRCDWPEHALVLQPLEGWGGGHMAHDAGNQGRLSASSDLRAGLREQRGPLSTSTGVSTLVGVGRENLCFSQAILASCLSKEGWEHSRVEGNKEDAGSLGQLLLVLLSWLLKSFPVWLCIEPPLPALSNRSRLG